MNGDSPIPLTSQTLSSSLVVLVDEHAWAVKFAISQAETRVKRLLESYVATNPQETRSDKVCVIRTINNCLRSSDLRLVYPRSNATCRLSLTAPDAENRYRYRLDELASENKTTGRHLILDTLSDISVAFLGPQSARRHKSGGHSH